MTNYVSFEKAASPDNWVHRTWQSYTYMSQHQTVFPEDENIFLITAEKPLLFATLYLGTDAVW